MKTECTLFVTALLLAFLPLIVSVANTPPESRSNVNAQYYDMADTFTYFANVRLGMDGEWLYRFKFNPEASQNQMVLHLPQILLGHLVASLHLPLDSYQNAALGYVLLIILTDIFLFWSLLYFLTTFHFDKKARVLILLFFFFAGGLIPPNFPGLFPSASLLFATTAADAALTLLVISSFYQRLIQKNGGQWLLTLSLLGLAIIHPYTLVIELTLMGLVVGYLFLGKRVSLAFVFGTALCTLPALLMFAYYFDTFYVKDLLGWVQTHNELRDFFRTPPPWQLLLIYNVQFLLIGYFAYQVIKKPNFPGAFLLTWFVAQLLLSYLPIGAQKVLVKGLGISTAVISGLVVSQILSFKARSEEQQDLLIFLTVIVAALCFTGYATTIITPLNWTLSSEAKNSYIYSPKTYFAALNFLDGREPNKKSAVIAEDEGVGRLIPAATGLASYNGYVTPSPVARTTQAELFFKGEMTTTEAAGFMKDNYLKYVITNNGGLDYPWLQKIYTADDLVIYLNSNQVL